MLAVLTLAASLLWAAAIVAAPWAAAGASPVPAALSAAAGVTYLAGHLVCHQRPERSFHAAGLPLPVCARCSGLYVAFPMALAVFLPWTRPTWRAGASVRWGLMAAAVPTVVSVIAERLTGWSTAPFRAAAGAALAIGLAWLVRVALAQAAAPAGSAASRSATLR